MPFRRVWSSSNASNIFYQNTYSIYVEYSLTNLTFSKKHLCLMTSLVIYFYLLGFSCKTSKISDKVRKVIRWMSLTIFYRYRVIILGTISIYSFAILFSMFHNFLKKCTSIHTECFYRSRYVKHTLKP